MAGTFARRIELPQQPTMSPIFVQQYRMRRAFSRALLIVTACSRRCSKSRQRTLEERSNSIYRPKSKNMKCTVEWIGLANIAKIVVHGSRCWTKLSHGCRSPITLSFRFNAALSTSVCLASFNYHGMHAAHSFNYGMCM
jgi:hypothetical protein